MVASSEALSARAIEILAKDVPRFLDELRCAEARMHRTVAGFRRR